MRITANHTMVGPFGETPKSEVNGPMEGTNQRADDESSIAELPVTMVPPINQWMRPRQVPADAHEVDGRAMLAAYTMEARAAMARSDR